MHLLCVVKGVVCLDIKVVGSDCRLFTRGCAAYVRWGEKDLILRKLLVNVFLAVITLRLVERPLTLDDPEVFQGFCNCTGLLGTGTVGSSEDEGAVFLACPAQVRHGLHQPD